MASKFFIATKHEKRFVFATIFSIVINDPDRIFLCLLVRFDSQMYPGVLWEVTRVGKGLVALGTLVRLGLPHVNLSVQLQICLRIEYLQIKKKKLYKGPYN